MAEQEFIDKIIQGFETLRERPHLDVLAAQFAVGEIAFVVDHRGIRILVGADAGDSDSATFD
ncbi:MAG: hypothetical protein ACRDSP_26140 [Pseudonocardiaceae bacterium]